MHKKGSYAAIDEYAMSVGDWKKTITLPYKYNVVASRPCAHKFMNVSEMAILHFVGKKKPWIYRVDQYDEELYGIYLRFMNMTVYEPPLRYLQENKRRQSKKHHRLKHIRKLE